VRQVTLTIGRQSSPVSTEYIGGSGGSVTGKRLRSAAGHAALVGALRAAADEAEVHVVINARTDIFLRKEEDGASDRVATAVARLKEAAAAGADVLYPVGRHDPETLRRLTAELPLPVNAIALPDQDDPASFGPLGVARISFGPFLQAALGVRAKEILARWG
jgi:2-methylisocitrate lyase-like PEP mutase family enzyme